MHAEARAWVEQYATDQPVEVLDLGGRDINGSIRNLFPNATTYRCLDILPGQGVHIVDDAGTWTPDQEYDFVVSTECFEHSENWRDIVRTAFEALRPGGWFIATMAGPGRPVHSGVDGRLNDLHPGETYANIQPAALHQALTDAGFRAIFVDQRFNPCDVRCVGIRPERTR